MSFVLRLLAAFCFLLAVLGVNIDHVILVPLGLLFWVVSTMVGDSWPGRRTP